MSWWHSDDGGEHNNIGEIGITPVIRFIKGAGAVRPFVETKRLSDSERAMLMGGACAKAYGWSPKK